MSKPFKVGDRVLVQSPANVYNGKVMIIIYIWDGVSLTQAPGQKEYNSFYNAILTLISRRCPRS